MKRRPLNLTKVNFVVDAIIMLAFAVEMEERFSGLRLHELLGAAIGAAFLTHLLLHWRWVVNVTRHFFAKLLHASRFSYALALLLLMDMAIAIGSGLLISRTLGLPFAVG